MSFLLVIYLFIIRPTPWNIFKLFALFIQVPYSDLKEYASFLYSENNLTRFPKKLKSRLSCLYGPSDRLSNLTIDEYAYADLFYYNWAKTKSDDNLNRLVAVLYRPKGDISKIDKRTAFNKDELKLHAKQVERLPKIAKIIIMMAFQGSRDNIINRHKYVFKKGSSKGTYAPFTKIIASMARSENQPFGDFYKTKDANLYDFMDMLNDELKEQKQRIANNKAS